MKRLALVLALVLALTAGALAPGASAGVPRSFYGIVPNTSLDANDFALMGQARVGSLRFQMLWSDIQSTHGAAFNFTGSDNMVRLAASQGITALPVLAGTPAYEENGCSSLTCSRHLPLSAQALADWKQFFLAAVQRYGPNGTFWQQNPGVPYHPVPIFQIYNELNNPVQHNTAKEYAKFIKQTDGVLTAAGLGNVKLMLGGMFGSPPQGGSSLAWKYLNAMYKAGAKGHFDGVALHPYAPKIDGIADQIKEIRKVMKANHDASTPTYITEIGWGSSKKRHPGTGGRGQAFNVGAKKQKENLTASFKLLTDHRKGWKIGGVYWFTWKDPLNPPDGLCAFCYSSGLIKPNGTTGKPALGAFKAFTSKTVGRR
jgi:hypothetical protein